MKRSQNYSNIKPFSNLIPNEIIKICIVPIMPIFNTTKTMIIIVIIIMIKILLVENNHKQKLSFLYHPSYFNSCQDYLGLLLLMYK